jgi:hypothetical protein
MEAFKNLIGGDRALHAHEDRVRHLLTKGYNYRMDARVDTATYRLVVTGPARDRLYERFRRLFWGREGVEVVKDRRVTERRRDRSQVAAERRSRERRRVAPDWLVPPS